MSTKTRKRTERTRATSPTALTIEDLDQETQKICPGFFPDRAIEPDPTIPPEQRIRAAGQLAVLYQTLGAPVPDCIAAIA